MNYFVTQKSLTFDERNSRKTALLGSNELSASTRKKSGFQHFSACSRPVLLSTPFRRPQTSMMVLEPRVRGRDVETETSLTFFSFNGWGLLV